MDNPAPFLNQRSQKSSDIPLYIFVVTTNQNAYKYSKKHLIYFHTKPKSNISQTFTQHASYDKYPGQMT